MGNMSKAIENISFKHFVAGHCCWHAWHIFKSEKGVKVDNIHNQWILFDANFGEYSMMQRVHTWRFSIIIKIYMVWLMLTYLSTC